MRNVIIIGIIGILLFCGGIAQAEPISIQISGNVTSANGSALPSTIYTGVSFTGTYSYDSSATPSIDNLKYYHYVQNAPYGIDFFLGGYEFETVPNHLGQIDIKITDDSPTLNLWDFYEVESYQTVSSPSIGFAVDFHWVLGDINHIAISSNDLPVTAPVLNDWGYNNLVIYGSDASGHNLSIYGTVTQTTLVPEPVTGILIVMGILLLRRR